MRHGGNHDRYKNPQTGRNQPVPSTKKLKMASLKESLRDYHRDGSDNWPTSKPCRVDQAKRVRHPKKTS
ncbi:MAG TPA: hypothetical protein VLK23_06325 [Thermodesulfobacteriota bacterium]|nr:hypothetical protein [Thermodesulfobacteriota bacterium]